MKAIYLDANATGVLAPEVAEALVSWLSSPYGNPSSSHSLGRKAKLALDQAREQVAELLGADPKEILFTSGATESIQTVMHTARWAWPEKTHLITSLCDHSATLECAKMWESKHGSVTYLKVDNRGQINLSDLEAALSRQDTALLSLIAANNETGILTSLTDVINLAHQASVPVHLDAAQWIGRLPFDVHALKADYVSFSGHKFHAPAGIGGLFCHHHMPLHPLLLGGQQEAERRAGTENLLGALGMGKAAELSQAWLQSGGHIELQKMREFLEKTITAAMPDLQIHGAEVQRLPNTTHLYLPGLQAAEVLLLLDKSGLQASGGSACHSAALHPSHVLQAMGYDREHANSSLRLSISRYTTRDDILEATRVLKNVATHLHTQKSSCSSPVISCC